MVNGYEFDRPASAEFAEKVRLAKKAREDAYLANCPKCAICGGQLYQSANAKRLKADGTQSWRHWGTGKVRGDDGHKAVA